MSSLRTDCYAAVDIGASSGRVVVGCLDERDHISLTEVHRFDNIQISVKGHDCWNLEHLFEEMVAGLSRCPEHGFAPRSIGIDTWGVDFVLLDAADELIGEAVAYRDARTEGVYELADAIMDPYVLYERTGIQRQPFNTIYQMLALQREDPDQLARAASFLMIPDYLAFRLCGVKANEYTNASTTGLLNACSGDWDDEVIEAFGLPRSIFLEIVEAGSELGPLREEIARRIGYSATVIAPASHDTGSSYLAVPAKDDRAVFLSSGTWSLLGVENRRPITTKASFEQNLTNEGGFEHRFRFLKNIMGLWMIQSIRRELNGVSYVEGRDEATPAAELGELPPLPPVDTPIGFGELSELARQATDFPSVVAVNDDRFLSPRSMIDELRLACLESGQAAPSTVAELMYCVYHSLALCYRDAIQALRELTGTDYHALNIVGGGCQDRFLNELSSSVCGLPVYAGPVEGTSLGNIAVQMLDDGVFPNLQAIRDAISVSFDVSCFDCSTEERRSQ